MEKTFSMVTRALNFVEDQNILQPIRTPLSDKEFFSFCDSVGQIIQPYNLRSVIYAGGIEPSLRRVVWKHILNVYPDGMTGAQRMDYMKRKSSEYYRLRDTWREAVQRGPVTGELAYVTSMVQKDVLRTDRLHPFYAGNDDNQNISSLSYILTTYALNHPAVSYCQGMSDIASPLLVTMADEAQAYICFCASMKRLNSNFMLDGIAMTQKFAHLADALQYYDQDFYDYLKLQQADDLLFCYRWLLLELKREFAFEDSLRMLEVLWSSLPSQPPDGELKLFEKEYVPSIDIQPPPKSPSGVIMRTPRETAYSKLCALRRQSSSQSLLPTSPNAILTVENSKSLDITKRLNQSLDENINRNTGRSVSKSFQSLDESQMCQTRTERDGIDRNGKNNQKTQTTNVITDNVETTELPSPTRGCVNSNHIHRASSLRQMNGNCGGHFKNLKERLVAKNKGIFASLDKIEDFNLKDLANVNSIVDSQTPTTIVSSGKIVKNFNEFFTLAATKKDSNNDSKPEDEIIERRDSEEEKIQALTLTRNQQRQMSLDGSSPEDSQEYFPMTTSMTRELRLELENLNRNMFGSNFKSEKSQPNDNAKDDIDRGSMDSNVSLISNKKMSEIIPEINYCQLNADVDDQLNEVNKIYRCSNELVKIRVRSKNELEHDDESELRRASTVSINADVFVWENPLHQPSPTGPISMAISDKNPFHEFVSTLTPDEQNELEYDGEIVDECSGGGKKSITPIRLIRSNKQSPKHNHISSHHNSDSSSGESSNDCRSQTVKNINLFMKSSVINETNPFLMDIATSLKTESLQTANHSNYDNQSPETATPADEMQTVPTDNLQKSNTKLPPPHEFGGGNPFLMFLCLTLLLQHRNYVIKNNMDYNEMAMHFDKMVRKHNVVRVLNQARRMYADYLKLQNVKNLVGCIGYLNRSTSDSSNNNSSTNVKPQY